MKCGACNRDCRVTKLANVAKPDGGLRSARVCKTCFDGALHIVAHIAQVRVGVDETKVKRRDAKEVMKAAVKKIRSVASAYRKPGADYSHYEGLEQAADLIEAGDY